MAKDEKPPRGNILADLKRLKEQTEGIGWALSILSTTVLFCGGTALSQLLENQKEWIWQERSIVRNWLIAGSLLCNGFLLLVALLLTGWVVSLLRRPPQKTLAVEVEVIPEPEKPKPEKVKMFGAIWECLPETRYPIPHCPECGGQLYREAVVNTEGTIHDLSCVSPKCGKTRTRVRRGDETKVLIEAENQRKRRRK